MLDFIITNWDNIAIIGGAIIAIAGVIVRLTPTTEDDKVFEVIMRGIGLIKSNVKVEDLETIKTKIEEFKNSK